MNAQLLVLVLVVCATAADPEQSLAILGLGPGASFAEINKVGCSPPPPPVCERVGF